MPLLVNSLMRRNIRRIGVVTTEELEMKTSLLSKALWKLRNFNYNSNKSGLLDYATIVSCNIIEDSAVNSIETDGLNLFFNPSWWSQQDVETQVFALSHEAEHIRKMHVFRAGNRDPALWNVACDICVNELKFRDGHKVASKFIMGAKFGITFNSSMTAEMIYDRLPKQAGQAGQKPKDNLSGGDFRRPTSNSATKDVVVERLTNVMSIASSMGYDLSKSPELQKLYEEVAASPLDWRRETCNFISNLREVVWSHLRPIPSYRARRIIIPGLYEKRKLDLGIVIDTSGSIYEYANEFIAMMKDSVTHLKPEAVTLIFADETIQSIVKFKEIPDNFPVKGDGGTNFVPALNYFKKNPNIGGVIYLTDGFGNFGRDPGYPILWVCDNNQARFPFGKVCRFEP